MLSGAELTSVLGSLVIIVANVILYLQNKKQSQKVSEVRTTLTRNNGGNHVKDQLDRIEDKVDTVDNRTERVELRQDLADRRLNRLENTLESFTSWRRNIEGQN